MYNFINKIFSIKTEQFGKYYEKVILNILGMSIKLPTRNTLFYPTKSSKHKTILLVRYDGIGDYLLMRPFIKALKMSKKYHDYNIIMACRPEAKNISQKYDNEYIEEYICMSDFYKFLQDATERRNFYKKLNKMHFSVVVNCLPSRNNSINEKVARTVKADLKVLHTMSNKITKKEKKIYDKFILTGTDLKFELERNKLFFELLTDEKFSLLKTSQSIEEFDLNSDFIVISPFASTPIRTYSADNYIKIMNWIIKNTNYKIIIMGGNIDYEKANNMLSQVIDSSRVINTCGKFTVSESGIYLKFAKMLISNDTGTVHLAQYYNTKTICISNGTTYKRFVPYPDNKNLICILPENIEEYLIQHNEYGKDSSADINLINPNQVIEKLKTELDLLKIK